MEIELNVIDGVKTKQMTFFNVDYVFASNIIWKNKEQVSIVSSGGKEFEVVGICEEIKKMIRESNLREASLVMNM